MPRRALGWILLGILVLTVILAPFILFEAPMTRGLERALDAAGDRPWLTALILVGLLASDSLLPVPSSIVSTFAGGALGFAGGAAVIWVGLNLGCLIGYAVGASAGRLAALRLVGPSELARAQRLSGALGPVALIVMRAVPVLAEASVLAAGAARMPKLPFFASTIVANAGVAAAYAATGAAAASKGTFLFAFLGLVGLPAAAWAAWRLWAKTKSSNERDS